ncbi:MAG: 3-hydroxylacyl-ACP dehydratase, partial [Acinetobacter sp.]
MMDAVQFIPHEKPMVFVSHLIEANDEFAIAELHIT